MGLGADLAMPFHEPLSVGLSLYDGYTWVYNVCGNGLPAGDTDGGQSAFGMKTMMQGTCNTLPALPGSNQPVTQSYGGELHVRYALPDLAGLKTEVSFAYAPLGDPTLGYANVQHGTGVDHVYLFWRQNAEIYAGLTARY
jgi:hypothetical protein